MREIPEDLAARLESGVTTFAHVWRITRRDAAAFGFTDHDEAVTFGDLICEPHAGLSPGAIEKSLGLCVDSASFAGALSSQAITEADLARGLWDGARVDLYRIDWTAPALRVHLFAGRLGDVRRNAHAFEAELRGLQAPLNVPVGRVFSRFCDADVGDARCGLDLDDPLYRGEGEVAEIVSATVFRASGLHAFAANWFTHGKLHWSDGGVSEVAAHSLNDGAAILEVLDVAESALTFGAAFVVNAGCDKRFETCRTKFANAVNFRGYPHMPGNDAVQAGPVDSDVLDGGSRFT